MGAVFVNGGVGFIGHHLCLELKAQDQEVYAIDNMKQLRFHSDSKFYQKFVDERIEMLEKSGIKIINLDVSESNDYLTLLNKYKPNLVYHMSAIASAAICHKRPDWAFSENMVNLERILHQIKNSELEIKIVFASSSVAYGEFDGKSVDEKTPLNPINIYGLLKKNGEELVELYGKNYGIPYSIIRPSALYGPRCVNRRVSQILIENILENKPVKLFGGGKEKLDFTYVDDTVQGFLKAGMMKEGENQTFNITYGEARSVSLLVDILRETFPNLEVEEHERDTFMPERGTLLIDKAKKLLNYNPLNALEQGYPKYIKWYLDRKHWISK